MNVYFEQLASSLLDLTSEATEYLTVGTTASVMVHQPSNGPDLETWPHLAIDVAGSDIYPSADLISYLFGQNVTALGKLESAKSHLFEDSDGGEVLVRVVLSLILPSGIGFTIDEDWFIREFALAINDKLDGSEGEYLAPPIVTRVRGCLYEGGPVHDEEIEYGPEEEEEEDLAEDL